ncbi:DoxX family protein [Mumia sp. Pv 4-285]|uniref:DoxX family protein n=1 Tax=Mumia qirimensis TaxID=3234852 RepID=UPI00351D50E2
MTLLRIAARPLLASMFVYGGVNALRNAPAMAARVQPVTDRIAELVESVAPGVPIPTDAESMVRINGTLHVAFGTTLALGRFPRLSALVLAGTMLPTTVAGHPFWKESDPAMVANQKIHFTKNLSILGGLLMSMLDPDPHKKLLARRAKDKVVQVSEAAQETLQDTASHLRDALPG